MTSVPSPPTSSRSTAPSVDPEKICQGLDAVYTKSGVIGYLHSLQIFLDSTYLLLEQNYSIFLHQSKQQFVIGPTQFFFEPEYVQIRVATSMVFLLVYEVLNAACVARVAAISSQLMFYSDIIFYITILIFVFVAASFCFAFRQAYLDVQYTYEIFSLIDPFYLLNNRYLQNRLSRRLPVYLPNILTYNLLQQGVWGLGFGVWGLGFGPRLT